MRHEPDPRPGRFGGAATEPLASTGRHSSHLWQQWSGSRSHERRDLAARQTGSPVSPRARHRSRDCVTHPGTGAVPHVRRLRL